MQAYCVKCKEKREMDNAEAVYTASGTPGTKGVCSVCGTKMFRMGRTEAHDGIEPPVNPVRKSKKKPIKREGKLVIVESPAKARTVGRFLGKGYTVEASVGHVRDLLRSQLSVDVDHNFEPKYRVPNEKRKIVKELQEKAARAEEIYLATDPDREGEAIAWHLLESADMDPSITKRVVFHEITKPAIEASFAEPGQINMDLVDAQQARRVLDRLVGYSISPILWRKVRNRLTAGRVQSVALRIIVEREREIEEFIPDEYWRISADFTPENRPKDQYLAKLAKIDGEDVKITSKDEADPIIADMEKAAYFVDKVKKGTRRRKALAPFTTSTMQQEASSKLSFTARRTMTIAQQLYEGIDMGDGEPVGLITYMRTDSVHVSELAQKEARTYIIETHGEDYVPEKIPEFKTKSKGAQEAHEAVRPTSTLRTPKEMKSLLTRDQYRLYQLIWNRFVASQMSQAVYETISVTIKSETDLHEYLLRSSDSKLIFKGYLAVYEETLNENGNGNGNDEHNGVPTDLEQGQKQDLQKINPSQHFTQPPARFSEATLVRQLEEYGIGRPSTYAPIIGTLQQRGYVFREEKRLYPTDTGKLVNDLLCEHFPNIVDVTFTADMESQLDKIAEGDEEWRKVIGEFYKPFAEQVEKAEEAMPDVRPEPEKVGRACPDCGNDLIIRWGRYGKFIGCSTYPECRYTEAWLERINVKCDHCETGEIVERRTRKGRVFYGCDQYPECDFTSWKKPVAHKCPSCKDGMLVVLNKRQYQCLSCEEIVDQSLFESEDANKESSVEQSA